MAGASDQSKAGFVTIATARSRAEALALAAKLKSAGIESLLSVERAARFPPRESGWFGSTKVQVSRSDVEAALRTLRRPRDEADGPPEPTSEARRSRSRRRIDLDDWRGAAMAVVGLIAIAVLLALWLF